MNNYIIPILIIILLLVVINNKRNEMKIKTRVNSIPDPVYVDQPLVGLNFHDKNISTYNGTISHLSANSWVYDSHTNPAAIGLTNSVSRKVDTNLVEGVTVAGRVTKVSFDFIVSKINLEDSFYWDIIYQDWVPVMDDGGHPITTLKLKVWDGKLYLAHYENSWQWGYDHRINNNGVNIDLDHSLHQENTLHGFIEIKVGQQYTIETITYDDGRFVFKVDDVFISDVVYQTKSPTEEHKLQWGQYWSKGYNVNNETDKKITLRILNFTRGVYLK